MCLSSFMIENSFFIEIKKITIFFSVMMMDLWTKLRHHWKEKKITISCNHNQQNEIYVTEIM